MINKPKNKKKEEIDDLVRDNIINQEKKGDLPITEKNDSLEKLIEKNIKWSQIIYEQNKKIKNRLTWMVVGSYLRLLFLLVPLILAIVYLPPLLKEAWSSYGDLLGSGGLKNIDIEQIMSQLSGDGAQEILKSIKK